MAIDTTNEKLALIEYGDIFQPGVPISSDGIGTDDKVQLLWDYPGLTWAEAVAAGAGYILGGMGTSQGYILGG